MIEFATTCGSNRQLDWVGPLLLCAEEVARVPLGIPGIYVLQVFSARHGFYPALYVGKSADLAGRLAQHMESQSTSPDLIIFRTRRRLYFSATPVLEQNERDAIEAGLIQLLRPPCNRQVPRARPIYPTLPPPGLRF